MLVRPGRREKFEIEIRRDEIEVRWNSFLQLWALPTLYQSAVSRESEVVVQIRRCEEKQA